MPKATLERLCRNKHFLRFLTGDNPQKARHCFELFRRADRGEINLDTSEAVIAEVGFELTSSRLYGKTREEVATGLEALLVTGGLRLDHKATVLDALKRFGSSNLPFVDCLCIEHAQRAALSGTVCSYDRGLDRVPGVCRLEP